MLKLSPSVTTSDQSLQDTKSSGSGSVQFVYFSVSISASTSASIPQFHSQFFRFFRISEIFQLKN
jgi:hypothetical protein